MLENIAFINPDPLMPKLHREISKHVRVIDAVMDEILPYLDELSQSVDVVITRGYTAEIIRTRLNLQVVNAEITSFDVLQTICRNRRRITPDEKEIAIVSHVAASHDIRAMEQIIGLKIHHFTYNSPADLPRNVYEAKQRGIRTMFGGIITQRVAPEYGLVGIVVRPNRETIFQAIQKAKDIAQIRRRDLAVNERFKSIVNLISEGIVAIGETDKIRLINPAAARMLGIDTSVDGMLADEVLPQDLLALMRARTAENGRLINTAQGRLIVNSTPVFVRNKRVGGLATLNDVSEVQVLEQKIRTELFSKGLVAKYKFEDIIGHSETLLRAVSSAEHYAQSDATVLITGESGTGKELFAQSIHQASPRRRGPFVAINCAALPEHLLESELFGYEEGAFTGARKGGKPGLFELAHKGTLFLDEISETSPHLQSHLLRVLQNKEVMRVGGSRVIPVNVRIIAATNKDIKALVNQGLFRNDLFYRLDVLRLIIPPLRERLSDIPYLVQYFLSEMSTRYNKRVTILSDKVIQALQSYNWPGNIRELENFMEKYVVMSNSRESIQDAEIIALNLLNQGRGEPLKPLKPTITIPVGSLEEMEGNILIEMDRMVQDKQKLAKRLGISRSTLWRKLQANNAGGRE